MPLKDLIVLLIILFFSSNLNAQWTEQDSGVIDSLLDVSFADPMNGCIIGTNETILTTNDGGKNWIKRDSPVDDVKFKVVQLIDKDNGFIIGDNGLILKTVDGGKNWTNISSLFMKYNFCDLSFVDPMNGWISCWWQSQSTPIERIGAILHTSDGGNEWETQLEIKSGLQFSTVFMGIDFLNDSLGWALGGEYDDWLTDDTYLYHTNDGGGNWEVVGLIDQYHKFELNVVDQNTIWCSHPQLFVSTSSGNNWSKYQIDNFYIHRALPINASSGWVWGYDQSDENYKIFYIYRNGISWVEDIGLGGGTWNSAQVHAMTNIDGEYLWVVGNKGKIHHRRGVPTYIENENVLAEQYELMQNYPNPFNPSTTVKYSIPKQSNVTLRVFDMLGSEVASLVNKEQAQGSYEVEFSVKGGSGSAGGGYELTSGIYLYQLQAGEFVVTKKMILLK